MNSFSEIFYTILTGDEDASRKAARGIRKLVYSSHGDYKELKALVNNAPTEYAKITDPFRQVNFVMAVSVMYFLHDKQNQPDFLFPWLFQLLQHDNGNVRHAAVRMIENELGPLTYHIRFPGEGRSRSDINPEQAGRILFGLQTNLNNLSQSSWKPAYDKYKYVNDLPSGTHKSVQLILGTLEEYCNDVQKPILPEPSNDILKERERIEQEINKLLKQTKSHFTLDHVKDVIYHEDGQDALTDAVAMFDNGQGGIELQNVLDVLNDAWNYFPHKIIGGLSPAEKLLEYNSRKK